MAFESRLNFVCSVKCNCCEPQPVLFESRLIHRTGRWRSLVIKAISLDSSLPVHSCDPVEGLYEEEGNLKVPIADPGTEALGVGHMAVIVGLQRRDQDSRFQIAAAAGGGALLQRLTEEVLTRVLQCAREMLLVPGDSSSERRGARLWLSQCMQKEAEQG